MSEQPQDTPEPTEGDGAAPAREEGTGKQEQTFTQAEIDRVVEARLTRERAKFKDYGDLKSKASKFDELEREKKTETERLVEDRDGHKSRADSAEGQLRRLGIAMEKAPEGTSLKRLKTIAERMRGNTDEELEADADELFSMFGVEATKKDPSLVKDRPREEFRGGANEPAEEPEETDPAKLAAMIPRRR